MTRSHEEGCPPRPETMLGQKNQEHRRARVFLSSSFTDLEPERICASEILRRWNLEVVCMEDQAVPYPESALSHSLDMVSTCDYFVGIYAHRYGTIPEGCEKSLTEQEYVRAREMGMPTYCYLSESVTPEFYDRDERKTELLREFIHRVKRENVPLSFSDLSDLVLLIERCADHIKSSPAETGWRSLIRPWYVERPGLLGTLGFEYKSVNGVLQIVGEPGVGRTTLTAQFLTQVYLRRVLWKDCSSEKSLHALLVKLAGENSERLDSKSLCERILALLRLRQAVLVLDDFHGEWAGDLWAQLCRTFRDADGLQMIAVGEATQPAGAIATPQFLVPKMEREEGMKLVGQYLRLKYHLRGEHRELGELVADRCNGTPAQIIKVTDTLAGYLLVSRFRSQLFGGSCTTEELEIRWWYDRENGCPLMAAECLLELTKDRYHHRFHADLLEVLGKDLGWLRAANAMELDLFGSTHGTGSRIRHDHQNQWETVLEDPNEGFTPQPLTALLSTDEGKRLIDQILEGEEK